MLVWLEDRRDTIVPYLNFVKSELNIEVRIFATPKVFCTFLADSFGEEVSEDRIKEMIFLVDIMMPGVTDLSDLGIENAPTLYGNHTGYVFADRYLREEGSIWSRIPICFLTERSVDDNPNGIDANVNALRERGGGPVEICRKYDQAEFERFKTFVREWLEED